MDQWHYRIEEFEVPSDERCTWDRQKLTTIFGGLVTAHIFQAWAASSQSTSQVRKNSRFKRLGDDLMADLRVSLSEAPVALLGFKRELVHLDGHIVTFGMDRGDVLKPGAALEIEGEGMPHKEDPSSAGKLVIRFHIDFPQSIPPGAGDDLEAALSKLPGQSKARVSQVFFIEESALRFEKARCQPPRASYAPWSCRLFSDLAEQSADVARPVKASGDFLEIDGDRSEAGPCRPRRPAQNEAQFLGVALPAGKMCNGQSAKVLSRPDFLKLAKSGGMRQGMRTLAKFPAELKIFERFAREAAVFVGPAESWQENMQDEAGKRLLAFLEAGKEFQGCEPEFLMKVLATHMVSGRLLAPGSTLEGNAWYVVLAGRVQVESPDGLLLRYAGPGEVLSLENSLVLRAVRGKLAGPALCLELSQPSGTMGSENVERWRRNVQQLRSEERETLERRRSWVQKVAVPALGSTQLLAGCPEDFLQLLAGQLSEEAFQEHQEIIGCNTEGDSMLVLLE
ncbi:unnamed protein product, partial [Cladocopium goreaui]